MLRAHHVPISVLAIEGGLVPASEEPVTLGGPCAHTPCIDVSLGSFWGLEGTEASVAGIRSWAWGRLREEVVVWLSLREESVPVGRSVPGQQMVLGGWGPGAGGDGQAPM